uniref:alkaline ceramidase 2 isoform X2 n=1 Tax=Ciona intestinalis TaxID=7719 RepID=UPI00006A74FC|nr:alkaline ceramidase 2 isoform X2 [Ciona intestinalis]|eukprot:XP_026696187.1 alkaline ceramidase 2 isoform X2 [Ciona intestinalis]
MEKSIWSDFLPHSSEVDWCENNYATIPIIAEFWNTVSNSIFFIIPPLLIYLFKQYSRQVCSSVNLVWVLLIFVGAGSVYFHSTLSLVGQLIDEIAILWVCLAALATWLPSKYLPSILRSDSCECPLVLHVGTMSAIWWCVAVLCWVSDRFLCNFLQFPYLHSAWHIMVCLASYMACVCYAYFYATNEVPEQCPRLRFWPHDRHTWFGIPYVSLLVTSVKSHKNL